MGKREIVANAMFFRTIWAGTVLVKSIPDDCVVVGNTAKILR